MTAANTNYLFKLLFPLFFTIALSACSSAKDGTELSSAEINQLLNNTEHGFNGQVIIVGAGAAGLAAASLLEKSGVDYKILEATDHYGGRVQKNTTLADFPIDLGAEWIHADKSSLNQLLGQAGTEPEQDVILYAPMDVLEISKSGAVSQVSAATLNLLYASYPEYKFKNTTWFDYLNVNFAALVKHNIIYNSPVTHIDYSGEIIKVLTADGISYEANKVISTVSVGVLAQNGIRFSPQLTAEKQQAIAVTEFYPGFKLFIKFSEDFYADMISFDTSYGEKTFYDLAYGKEAEDKIVGLLSTGESANFYYQLGSEQKILQAALAELDRLYNGKATASYTGEYVLQDWGHHKFTLGTWTDDIAGKYEQALVDSLDNKVYFAGEAFDTTGARSTVHGAILSGYDAAQQLLQQSPQ